MNYLELINNFWRKNEIESFGTVAGLLYFHILDISNKQNWRNPFKRQNTKICADLGISKPTLERARNELKLRGMIDFKSRGKGDPNIQYEIIDTSKKLKNITTSITTSVPTNDAQSVRLIKTDTNNEILNNINQDRASQIEAAISDFTNRSKEKEKEKSSGQKEKEIPSMGEVADVLSVRYVSKWELCLRNQVSSTPAARAQCFELFWKMNIDDYKVKYQYQEINYGDIMSHFFNWLPTHQRISNNKQNGERKSTKPTQSSRGTAQQDIPKRGGFGNL